jgi:hypothetical protein
MDSAMIPCAVRACAPRVGVASLVLLAALLVAAPIVTAAPKPVTPVEITFTGTGSWTMTAHSQPVDDCDGSPLVVDFVDAHHLQWTSRFNTAILDDGTIAPVRGLLDGPPGLQVIGQISYNATVSGGGPECALVPMYASTCTSPVRVSPAGAEPTLSTEERTSSQPGKSGIELTLQGITRIGETQPACDVIPSSYVIADEGAMNIWLPGALTAVALLPEGEFEDGHFVTQVSSANSIQPPPSDCPGRGDAGITPLCGQRLAWTGTVEVRAIEDDDELAQIAIDAAQHTLTTGKLRGAVWLNRPLAGLKATLVAGGAMVGAGEVRSATTKGGTRAGKGKRRFTVRLTRKGRASLGRRPKVSAVLTFTARVDGKRKVVGKRPVTLRR